ncbi:hypothetical protein O0547_29130, partial [Brevibacillus laterosporus]|nr:hypothetical protein [Brevibacillus laterosporus]MCZ0810534.1 hypothetical protein [Brevibacillus laterosporus]MCZ0829174.1 hypothetical protein [Brevibacillus laterosporus]MCZ0853571.1 hypothetical protein [Brevibacillus laterosporus]
TEVLKLPYKDIVEQYAKIEKRIEVLLDLIIESIEIFQFQLIPPYAILKDYESFNAHLDECEKKRLSFYN